MKNNEVPCYQCLMVPLCKHKSYGGVLKCSLIHKFLYLRHPRHTRNRGDNFRDKLLAIDEILKTDFVRILEFDK